MRENRDIAFIKWLSKYTRGDKVMELEKAKQLVKELLSYSDEQLEEVNRKEDKAKLYKEASNIISDWLYDFSELQ